MILGTFISVWDGGMEISTPAELHEETGEISTESVDVEGLDLEILEREYFVNQHGGEFEVCTECHSYILNDKGRCSDPNCK